MVEQKIILYTIHCPKCKVLEMKLKQKGVSYEEHTDAEEMLQLGFKTAPILKVGDEVFDFSQAIQWINKQDGQEVVNS